MTTAAPPEAAMATSIMNSQRDHQGQARLRRIGGLDPEAVEGEQRGEDPDHEDLGVGEVDEPQHAVDQRVAEGDQGVDRAQREAVKRLRPELVPQAGERRS